MPIGDGLIRLGTVLEGFGNEAEARRQLEFKERKTQATRDFYLQQQEFINEAESLGDSFDETALEDMKSRSRDAFKSRAQTLMDGLHPDRARAIEAEANQNAVITELTLERRATRAMVERLKVQGPESYESLVSPLNKNPEQIYSTLDALEANDANIAENVFDSEGNEVQVFSAAQRELLKNKGISEAYTTAFSGLLYGNSDGVIPRNGLAQAKQLLSDKADHIQQELGAEWVQRYKGMINSVEANRAAAAEKASNHFMGRLEIEAEKEAEGGLNSLMNFLQNNPETDNFSPQKHASLLRSAEKFDNLILQNIIAVETGARFEPQESDRKLLDKVNQNYAQTQFLKSLDGGFDSGMENAINSLNDSFPQGYLPRGSIQFLAETITSEMGMAALSPKQREDFAQKILETSYRDPNHKTPKSVIRDLSLIADGFSVVEIENIRENANAADPLRVDIERRRLSSPEVRNNLQKFRENFVDQKAAHNIFGIESIGGGGDIDIPLIPTFRIGRDIVIPDGIEGQISKNARLLVESGIPAETAYTQAFREAILTEEHGNTILSEGSTVRVVSNSPVTKTGMGENAYKGLLLDLLVREGEFDPDLTSGWYDRLVLKDRVDNYDAIAEPALRNGQQWFRIVYSPLHPEKAGEPVYRANGEPLVAEFSEGKGKRSWKQIKEANPEKEWAAEYRASSEEFFNSIDFGGATAREKRIEEWMSGQQVRTWRSDPSSRPLPGEEP